MRPVWAVGWQGEHESGVRCYDEYDDAESLRRMLTAEGLLAWAWRMDARSTDSEVAMRSRNLWKARKRT